MSNFFLAPRARAALALVPLVTVLACASGGARSSETMPAPLAKPPVSDTASIANGDGKTVENMLAGRFPGVTVTPVFGGGLQIRVRGGSNSFYGGSEPLFVLDEVALPAGSGGIVHVNPYDIAKIEVLKNPTDVAIYGVRGGNGVVKITTKKAIPPKQ